MFVCHAKSRAYRSRWPAFGLGVKKNIIFNCIRCHSALPLEEVVCKPTLGWVYLRRQNKRIRKDQTKII